MSLAKFFHRSGAILVLAGACCAASARAAEPTPAHYYTYQSKPVPLTIDTTRIAVFRAPGADPARAAAPDLATALAPFDIDPASISPHSIPGWSTARLSAAVRTDADVELLVAAIAAAGAADFVSPIFDNARGPIIITRDVFIGFEPGVTAAQADQIVADAHVGAILERDYEGMKGVCRVRSASLDGAVTLRAANTAAAHVGVRFAEPDMIATGAHALIPNDPFFGSQWAILNTGQSGGVANMDMDGDLAWEITTGSPSIIVVILDVGVQQNHPDINQIPGMDFTGDGGGGGPANQCDVHGTAVAGCVSAILNNSIGIVGIAPSCRVASAKFATANVATCDGTYNFQFSVLTSAINWSTTIGARVTNNSNILGATSSVIDAAYNSTYSAGVIHFACAGNNGSATLAYPASIPVVNSVAAITRTGALASFSQHGPGLDFSAPGQSILSTDRTGVDGYTSADYATVDGTSFASPYAAGVAALVLSINPSLSPADVELAMRQTATDLGVPGYDTTFGYGLVNANRAVLAVGCAAGGVSPTFSLQPAPTSVFTGQTAMITAAASSTSGVQYAWRKNTVPLASAGRISGANTNSLSISMTIASDSGTYDVVATNPCGATVSSPATLTIRPPCPADLNHDGVVGAPDLGILLGSWGPPGIADFNASGATDTFDLAFLLGSWGPCA